MPVSFNSPARNLFLLGSSGGTTVTNFFKTIADSSTDGVFITREIAYNYTQQNYILSGFATDSQSNEFGWFEKRDYDAETDPDNPTSTLSFRNKLVNTQAAYGSSSDLRLMDIHLDYNDNIIACGIADTAPFIAKYSNAGVLDWQSTTFSGNVEYKNVCSDTNGTYYASGNTVSASGNNAFVEKFDANGNPTWGKSATALGKDVNLDGLASNSRGHVVAVGHVEDDTRFKGYIVKINTNTGDVMWDKTLSSSEKQGIVYTPVLCEDVFIDDQDNIYVVGRLQGVPGATRSFLMKLSPEGNIIWQKETADNFEYYRVKADGATGQVVVFGRYYDANSGDQGGVIAKYSRGGNVAWRRTIFSSYAGSNFFGRTGDNGGVALDADPSFYYVLYTDDDIDELQGTPDSYTFGKVSTSGNGLGPFEYDDGNSESVYYDIVNADDRVGRLQDGSVRNDVSDLVTYPFNATRISFDDFATPVANKKRQMDDAGNFEYSGSPAIRVSDFQELNLLGDVYSGSGDWLDQSGKGNDAATSSIVTTTLPGTTESENFRTVTSSYSTYGTVAENTVTNDLPYNNADWSHYGGKVRDLQTGGFKINLTGNSTNGDFFMACWIKFDTYATSRQMGIDLFGDYVYWETLASGAIAVRHNGGSRADSNATSLNDGYWHHIALSRTGGTLYGMLDGSTVISTTSGVSGNSVQSNENFWFFGGSGNAYNTDAKILDPIVCIGTGVSGYTVPTEPVIDANGTFPNAAPHVPFFSNNWAYISPAVSLGGTTTTSTNTVAYNASGGYFEFDGTNDKIVGPPCNTILSADSSIELWVNIDNDGARQTIISGYDSTPTTNPDRWDFEITDGRFRGGFHGNGYFTSLTLINPGDWNHVMLVLNSSTNTLKFYLNGVENVSQSCSGFNFGGPDVDLGIGDRNESSIGPFDGKIGEVRIYPKALTAAQVFQNYNATKTRYVNEASDTAPKITSDGIVIDSSLILNYDFGNRATYDDAQNYLLDNFAEDEEIGEYLIDDVGKHEIYYSVTNLNSSYGGSQFFPSGTYDVSVSMWMKADDFQTNQFALKDGLGAPVTSTYNFTPKLENPDGGIISHTWTNVTINSSWNFGVYNNNGDARTMLYARPQLTLKPSTGRYVKTYSSVIAPPTTVNNLSSNSFPGTIYGGAKFNSDGYFEFDGGANGPQYLQSSSVMSPGSANFSVIMWYKVDTNTGRGGLFERADSSPYSGWILGQGGSNNWSCSVRDASNNTASFQFTYPTIDQWTCDAFTWDTGTLTLTPYRNGANAGTASNSGTVGNLDGNTRYPMAIGGRLDSFSPQFKAMECGEVQMYTKVLTPAEVLQNFNATRGKYGV